MNAHENENTIRDFRKVLEISRSLAAAADLDSLLELIIARSMELLDAERASLFLYDATTNELVSRIATGVKELRIPADRGICGAVVKTGGTINVTDAYADDRFNPHVDRTTGFRTRNILTVPLRDFHGSLVGVLQVLNKRRGAFSDHDVTLAETLGAQAGVGIQRANLIAHYIEKQEMERAMQIARGIQRGLLPEASPSLAGFDIAGFSEAADETGGDIYDFFPLPEGRWGLMVADASGHGIGPAMVIAETRAVIRAMFFRDGCGLAEVLATVNRLLNEDLSQSRFVTCFLGVLDPAASMLTYASAGHGPLIFYDRAADRFDQLPATALPLGVMEDSDYGRVESRTLATGDLAMILTDGFFEAANPGGEEFGLARTTELLGRQRDLPASQIIAGLHKAVLEFSGAQPQADDLTAILIRRN